MSMRCAAKGPRVRWGIIGMGNIARKAMAPAIRKAANAELLAVASRDSTRAEALAKEAGAPRAHASYDDLLADPDVDAVYIGLPNGLHEEWTLACAEAGKHVLCEKSLTFTVESAMRMRDRCREGGVLLAEAFMYRHHPQWRVVKEVLRSGKLGRVVCISGALTGMLANERDHRWSRELGGGALFDVTCYPIDAARYLLDAEPEGVCALADLGTSDRVDRASTVILRFPGDVLATALGSLCSHGSQFLSILCANGVIEIPKPFIPGNGETSVLVRRRDGTEELGVAGADQFELQVEHFSRCVLDASARLDPAEDGVCNAAVWEAAEASWGR